MKKKKRRLDERRTLVYREHLHLLFIDDGAMGVIYPALRTPGWHCPASGKRTGPRTD